MVGTSCSCPCSYPCSCSLVLVLGSLRRRRVPNNVRFVIDDANEEDWMIAPDSLDYVHTRMLSGCFADFGDVLRKSFRCLKPGGWMESQDYLTTLLCDDGTMGPDYAFAEWSALYERASVAVGRPARIADALKRSYEQAGFVDVRDDVFKLPVNSWPRDPQFKMLGRFQEMNMLDGLQAFTLKFFQKGLHWTADEIEVYLVKVRQAISDRSVHAYHKLCVSFRSPLPAWNLRARAEPRRYVVWGRKPHEGETR